MRRAFEVLLALAGLSMMATPASAEEKPILAAEARAGYMLLGGERPTGGLTLGAGVRYLHPFGAGPWGVYGGLGAAAVGVGDSWHWLGLLAAPEAGAWWASGPWHLSAGLGLPLGQLPTCTDWGMCLRSWVASPEVAFRGAVRTESLRIGLEVSALWVETLPWSGPGGQLRIVGAYR